MDDNEWELWLEIFEYTDEEVQALMDEDYESLTPEEREQYDYDVAFVALMLSQPDS